MSEPSGSLWPGPSASSRPAGTPAFWSALHMAGSQATMASLLTCWTTHTAACRLAAAAPVGPVLPLLAWDPARPLGLALLSASRIAKAARHLGLASRRRVHSRTVVARTVPQPGSAGRVAPGRARPGGVAAAR